MIALGIDPDLHTTGVGLVEVSPENNLVALETQIIRVPHTLGGPSAELAMIRMLAGTLPGFIREHSPGLVVVEGQRIYPMSHARPNDLMRLARMAGAAAASCMWPPRELMMPMPQEWKGTVPKEIHQNRMMAKLRDPISTARGWYTIRKADQTHVIDAIALAMWGLQQLGKSSTASRRGIQTEQSQLETDLA